MDLINCLDPSMLEDPEVAQFLRRMALNRILNRSLDKVSKEEIQAFNAFLQTIPKQ